MAADTQHPTPNTIVELKTPTGRTVAMGGDRPVVFIAGPCALENRDHAMMMSEALKTIADDLGAGLIYKTSFDKANRTSISGYRGMELDEALRIFEEVRKAQDVPMLTDVHLPEQCATVAEVADVLQIPAFLCRQTDLLVAAAETDACVNVKKGQFLAPWDMRNVVNKLLAAGARDILLTERGASFGYNTLVTDFRALPQMAETGCPVVFDATHSVQQPGGRGESSGGQREFVPVLARAAAAVGVSVIFMEVHQDPDNAPSDGPNMVPLGQAKALMSQLMEIDALVKAGRSV